MRPMTHRPLNSLLFAACCIVLAGCAGQTPGWQQPDVVESEDAAAGAPIERELPADDSISSQAARTDTATLALLDQADEASARSDHQIAIAYLERAVRIEPRNADLWIRLSAAHLHQGNLSAASQHVRKAIALAGTDSQLQRRAWLQLADIRDAEGNNAEADAIRRRYAVLRG